MKFNHTQCKIPNTQYRSRGQSLVELLVAIAIGTILIGGSVAMIGASIRSYGTVKEHLQANTLIRQNAEIIQSLVCSDWHSIYGLSKGSDYQVTESGNVWTISAGQETDIVNDISYKRYFQVYDVNRDGSGNILDAGTDDPSTQKITIILEYGDNYTSSSSISFYLTRSKSNTIFGQTDWSGGDGVDGPVVSPGITFDSLDNIQILQE